MGSTSDSLPLRVCGGLCALVGVVVWVDTVYGLVPSLVVGMSLAIAAGLLGANRLLRSLDQLTRLARAYATANFSLRLDHRGLFQACRPLAESLAAMAQAVATRVDDLIAQRNRATAILESMAEGVIAVDSHGQILLVNPSAEILLGMASGSVGHSLFERVRHLDVQALVQGVLQEHHPAVKDVSLFQPAERIVRIHGALAEGRGPHEPVVVLVIQDITEHSRYERLRKEFVANVSHELKTPLTTIRSLAETLLEGALDDSANNRRFVELIDHDAHRLSRLIDDLLALSQIESQAVPLRLARVELAPLIDDVRQSLQPAVDQRRLTVTAQIPPGLAVRADPDRVRQVLLNLLDNAIKYNTEGGSVTLSAMCEDAWVRIQVADTGIGIAESDAPRIFERFYRVEKSRARQLGGTGLGLAIVKHIVESHGGQVAVTSQLHRGSTFSLTLPLFV